MNFGQFYGNVGSAAPGALAGVEGAQTQQMRQFQLQQARDQQARQAAATNAQRAADAAYRQTLQSIYGAPPPGPQSPMPGQPSVPTMQPDQQSAPALQPYQALPTSPVAPAAPPAGGVVQPPSSIMPSAPMQNVQLPPKPQRQALDMQTVMANAPQDPDAFSLYMDRMGPLLSAQDKSALAQQKQEMDLLKIQNQFMESEQRIANATTPAERAAALAANLALKQQLADAAKENADTKRDAERTKVTKGGEKKQQSDEARKQAAQLVSELKLAIAQNPGVVGIRGKVGRGVEAVKGAFGGTDSAAHDFQQKIRMLQNIVKKVEPYGPEGRVLKGELADRDQIVEGLGTWTSAPNALSGLETLEKFLTKTYAEPTAAQPAQSAGTAQPTQPAPAPKKGYIDTDKDGRKYRFKGGNPANMANWERV